ncbi:protein THEM6-like [Notechis scutatus]|uniref:Protein THEM6 n=1 Tax=Notechis scutatus TaxID=8663 RepID=A0A6J1VS07_9SAUR|nr:protein THEM6-like [Notechis scutatus]
MLPLILFSLVCLGVGITLALLDIWYLSLLGIIYCRWRLASPKTKVWEESIMYNWVLPSDLDVLWHMNNGRYARKADFGRYWYMFSCGLMQTILNNKHNTMMTSSSWRFRRSLKLWERFAIRTRMLCWDDQAFYLEQQFINCRDGFVHAIVLVQHHVTGMSPSEVIQILYGRQVESPEIPGDVYHWLKSMQNNRERMKNEIEKNSESN